MVEIHVVFVRFHHGVPDWSQAPQVTSHPTTLSSDTCKTDLRVKCGGQRAGLLVLMSA